MAEVHRSPGLVGRVREAARGTSSAAAAVARMTLAFLGQMGVVGLIGFAAVSWGVSMIHRPSGFIALGISLLLVDRGLGGPDEG
jgi:hypothetical protein